MVRHIVSDRWGLLARARELRKPMTHAQRMLWCELKARKTLGCRFERQQTIDRYIVDFYCADLALAIDVDELGRDDPYAHQYERERDVRLRLCGVAVLRFTEEEVVHNLDGVLSRIRRSVRYL